MGQLNLRLEKQHLGTDVRLGVVARVRQIKDAQGNFPAYPTDKEVVIPAGQQEMRELTIPAGTYRIEARLPSGEILRETRNVSDDAPAEVKFDTGQSPVDWLSWQRLAGNVPSQEQYEVWISGLAKEIVKVAQAKIDASKPIEIDKTLIQSLAGLVRSAHLKIQPALRAISDFLPIGGQRAVLIPRDSGNVGPPPTAETAHPAPAAAPPEFELVQANPLAAVALWDALGSLPAWNTWRAATAIHGGYTATRRDDRQLTQWQITQRDRGITVGTASGSSLPMRCLAVMRRGNGVDVIMLPVPWPLDPNQPPVVLEVLREAGISEAGQTAVAVRDPSAAGLIAYLGKGQIADAATLLDDATETGHIQDLISEKFSNPLAACAAAYVGIATFDESVMAPWKPWLVNLESRFDWLPDGAIVWATYRLKTARTREDLDAALASLKKAYQRGVPFYATGLRHLMNGLYRFSEEDGQAKAMYDKVAGLAWHVDPDQPFSQVTIPGG